MISLGPRHGLLFCLLFWLCPWFVCAEVVVDLRQASGTRSIELDQNWVYVPMRLLSADAALHTRGERVSLPHLWPKQSGQRPGIGYATYTTRLLLPPGSSGWGLTVPDAYSSYYLYANGKLLAANGRPDSLAERYIPLWFTSTVPLPTADTIDLVWQVANFDHSKGGLYRAPTLGLHSDLQRVQKHNNALDLIMSGSMLMGGLFFLGLFIFGRHDKAMLFFALFCLVYSYRPMGSRWYAVQQLIPNFDWHVALRLEYFSLYTAIGLFTAYTFFLYPRDVWRWLLYFFMGFNGILALGVLVLPPYYYTQTLVPFLVTGLIMIVYSAFVYAKAWYYGRVGSAFAFISTVVIMAVLAVVNLEYFDVIIPTGPALFTGYALFLFLQSLVLAFRFADALNKARKEAMLGLQAKTDFLSTMSHEIRTPLNGVIGMTHLLLQSKPHPSQQEQLEVMLHSSHNLLSIVNDILDYNKIEAGKVDIEPEVVQIRQLCGRIVAGLNPLADEKGLQLSCDIKPNTPVYVAVDPTRLTQILMNLLHNAIKFTDAGEVRLQVEVSDELDQQVHIRFAVSDTGIGIEVHKLERIFDRFTQADSSTSRKYGGTGLGLAIARRLVELQGGTLQVESELGKGTRFWFELPLTIAALPDDQTPTDDIGHPGWAKLRKVMLVDDHALNRKVARAFLERWELQVLEANDGQEAVDTYSQNRDVDLILMDLHMPVMDGYEATKRIRALGSQVPIVALTASLPKEVEHQAYEAGVNAVVVKPFHPNDLYQQVKRFLS